ncbi:TPR-like protein [Coprinopsis marcescibilis]|uniref:TPR-like protein n=1 Tax=Coprinopsis marcescibilis TaxID=230819 RepID=A0A5C3KPA5_COPMA|nr:TPR-like protein [Coprinopsis marcescibilis]
MQYRGVHETTLQVTPFAGRGPRDNGPAGYCDGRCTSRLELQDSGVGDITSDVDEESRGWALYDHLSNAHPILDRNEIASVAAEAVRIFLRLADKDPTTYEPPLSDVLNRYAIYCSALGEDDEALRIGGQAVDIGRRLMSRNSHNLKLSGHLSSLLYNLARYFAQLQRFQEALPPIAEAFRVLHHLANKDPGYEPRLADSTHHYAIYLFHAKEYQRAMVHAHEAVEIRSRLAGQDPANFEHHLAWSLLRLSECYYSLERYDEALTIVAQSIELQRHLISHSFEPVAFKRLLADSLIHHACCLSESNMKSNALGSGTEAMVILRGLAALWPKEFTRPYVASITRLAYDLSFCGRSAGVELLESLLIFACRRLSKQDPDVHDPALAHCLHQRALSLSARGWHHDALEPQEEAIRIRQRFARVNPAAYEPFLADSLHQYALDLSRVARYSDAVEPATRALEIRIRLASVDMAKYEDDLAWSYYNLACYLSSCDRYAEAIPHSEGVVEIRRQIVQRNPQDETALSSLRNAIENYGMYLSQIGRYNDAVEPEKEAVDICRTLVALDPDQFEGTLATTLYMLAFDLNYCDRNEEAADAVKEAIDIRRRLVAKDRYRYIEHLADSLNQYAWYLIHCPKRVHQAFGPAHESVAIYREMLEKFPDTNRLEDLANSLDTEAQSLFFQERYEEALPLIEEALEIYPKMVSGGNIENFDHVGSALYQTYGRVLWKLGREAEAVEPLREAVVIYCRLIKVSHPGRYERRLEDCVTLLEALTS